MNDRLIPQFDLYSHAPLINRQELEERFAAWSSGLIVPSEVVEAGSVRSLDEGALLDNPLLQNRAYSQVMTSDPLFLLTAGLRNSLHGLAEADMARSGLQGEIRVQTVAGMYEHSRDADPLHADNFKRQQVRWTVAHGIDGTSGASGHISKHDLVADDDGTLKPEAANRFRIVRHDKNTAVRFSVSDVHAGCDVDGPRILNIATWVLR